MKYTIFDEATGALANPATPFVATLMFLQPGQGAAETADEVEATDIWDAVSRTWTLDMEALRGRLVAQVNAGAGGFRRRFITDIPGQEATYLTKEREARAWTAGSDPASAPFLAAEAAARGVAIDDVAALVVGLADQWTLLGAAIEGARQGALAAIAAASTPAEAEAAAAVDWDALLP